MTACYRYAFGEGHSGDDSNGAGGAESRAANDLSGGGGGDGDGGSMERGPGEHPPALYRVVRPTPIQLPLPDRGERRLDSGALGALAAALRPTAEALVAEREQERKNKRGRA